MRESWEKRAGSFGASLAGVLFQGLSEAANLRLHEWHSAVLMSQLIARLPTGAKVLDMGCGYGRLTAVAMAHRRDLEIVGQDIALTYCKAYQHSHGQVVQADVSALPFREHVFDGVIAVTSLMYVSPEARRSVFHGLARILRSGGQALLLDPGAEIQGAIRRLRRSASISPTGGLGFYAKEYGALATDAGLVVTGAGGNPYLTAALLIPGVGRTSGAWQGKLLDNAAARDAASGPYFWFGLHRWILVNRL